MPHTHTHTYIYIYTYISPYSNHLIYIYTRIFAFAFALLFTFTLIVGGYFLWIKFKFCNNNIDGGDNGNNDNDNKLKGKLFTEYLLKEKSILVLHGTVCSPPNASSIDLNNYARLCFANLPKQTLIEGCRVIGDALREYNSLNHGRN